jgi:DNA polymerase III gamma/tau subunit
MDQRRHRDVLEVNCGDKRGIDDIRGLLKTIRFAPQYNYRVFILDEVHQLTPQAMQALFKDIEEPPLRTIFVLCTTEPGRILGQVPSRAIKLPIQQVPVKVTAKLCAHVFRSECKKKVKPAVFLEIAKAVDGHPRDALTVLESVINQVNQGSFKTANLTKEVSRIVRRAVPGNPDQFAKIILLSVYKGQYTRAIDSVRKYQTSGGRLMRLIDVCLRFHAEAIARRCSKKLASPYYADWYKLLQGSVLGKDGVPVSVLVKILNSFISCQSQLKSYLVDEYYVTLSAVTDSVNLVQSVTLPPGKKKR